MRKRVIHIDIEEEPALTPERTVLKTFSQTPDRYSLRKNSKQRPFSRRPQTTKSSLSQGEPYLYPKSPLLENRRRGTTLLNFRKASKQMDNKNLLKTFSFNFHNIGSHSDRTALNKHEAAKNNLYKKIEAHNSSLVSKMFNLGREGRSFYENNGSIQHHSSALVRLEDTKQMGQTKVSQGTKGPNKYKKWEARHQGIKKFMNQTDKKVKAQQKYFKPWQTGYDIDQIDY